MSQNYQAQVQKDIAATNTGDALTVSEAIEYIEKLVKDVPSLVDEFHLL